MSHVIWSERILCPRYDQNWRIYVFYAKIISPLNVTDAGQKLSDAAIFEHVAEGIWHGSKWTF